MGSLAPGSGLLRMAVIAALCGTALAPSLALDFQLHTVQVTEDGFTHPHSCFRYDDHTEMLIDLPRGWIVSADAGSITAAPPSDPTMQIRIERLAASSSAPVADPQLDVYRQRALAIMVPGGASDVKIVKESLNPLPVFHWKDVEFEVTYTFYGRKLHRSALFIRLNARDQIVTTVSAEDADFEKAHMAAMDTMRSWCPAPPNS
jgi:hypothetical protein